MRQSQANSHNQPTPRVGNQKGRKCDIIQDDNAPRSGRQQIESGSSHRAQLMFSEFFTTAERKASSCATSQVPHRGTLHTEAYNEHVADQDEDGKQRTETLHLSDDSCDEYQNFHISNDTKLDTEPDSDENDIPDDATSVTHHQLLTKEKRINNRVSTVQISSTSGSQEAILVRHTPAAQARIIRSSVYTAPTISSSGVSRYSSPLAAHRATTSAV